MGMPKVSTAMLLTAVVDTKRCIKKIGLYTKSQTVWLVLYLPPVLVLFLMSRQGRDSTYF